MSFQNIAMWAMTIFLGLSFILAGTGKFLNAPFWVDQFTGPWGLPAWLVYPTGAAELIGGFLILVPKLAMYGGGLIVAVMIGATATHLMAGEVSRIGVTLLLGGLAAIVANLRRNQLSSN